MAEDILSDDTMLDQAYNFFKENAHQSKDKAGVYNVNQADYTKFLKGQGFTEEMQKRYAKIERAVTGGAIKFTQDIMIPLIEKAKADGQDPKDVRTKIRIANGVGNKIVIDGYAHRKYPMISQPGNFQDAYGVVQLKVQRGSAIDQGAVDALAARVAEVM